MSNKNKLLPLEIISRLLTELLDSRLNKLEEKSKKEIGDIKAASQDSELMKNKLQNINKRIKQKVNAPKKSANNTNQPSNNINEKISTSKSSITLTSKKNNKTPDRSCISKLKSSKNNCLKKLTTNKSQLFFNDFLNCQSNHNSKILKRRNSKISKKHHSRKKTRDLTLRSTTPYVLTRKKKKEKPKPSTNVNRTPLGLIKHSNTNAFLNKNYNNSCKILPYVKKKLNKSILSKNDELDLICSETKDVDKRIYQLNPHANVNKLKKTNKKIKSSLFREKSQDFINIKKNNENKILNLDESLMNDVNNDELLIFYHSNQTSKLIDDICINKSFIGDDDIQDCDLDFEINIEKNNEDKKDDKEINNNKLIKNDNISIEERIEMFIENLAKYLSIEDLIKIALLDKACFKIVMHYIISKKDDFIDDIKESLLSLKKNNSDVIDQNENNNNFSIKPFSFNLHSKRAIDLLNSISIKKFFHKISTHSNNKNVILIFDIFFIALGYKNDIISFKNDPKLKWEFYKKMFEENNEKSMGTIIENKLKGRLFTNDIINSLFKYSHRYINIITPSYFQNIDSDFALFIFIIKNILEHIGITKDTNNKKNVPKLYLLYNAIIDINTDILKKLNKINSTITNKK